MAADEALMIRRGFSSSTANGSARPGPIRARCSPPKRACRSSRATSTAPSAGSATITASAASRFALRHTTASLLKALGVPPKDAQVTLGHAHASTTEQIYTHVDQAAMREAITKLNRCSAARMNSRTVVSNGGQDSSG